MIKIGEDVILIGCIYRPHNFNDDYFVSVIATILAAKNVLQKLECSSMLLYGDFNLKETSYKSIEEGSAVATIAYVAHKHPTDLKFQECLNECHLTQLVTFPTYRQYRDAPFSSTLDLIISDKPDRSIEITRADHLGDTPGGQAHCMIHGLFALTGHNTTTTPIKKRFIWSKADYNSISTCISSIDWITTFNGSSVHENYKILVKNYNDAVNKFIPTTTSPFYKNQPLWITPEVLKTIKKKEKLWGKYIAAGRETHEALRVKHKLACKIVKKTINKAVTDHEEKLVKDSKSHPKNVHAYVRSEQEVKDPLHSIETDNGIITTDKNIICSTLNNYFQSVFETEPDGSMPTFPDRTQATCKINENWFTIEDIQSHLNNLEETKSIGVDGIHPRVLRNCAAAFAIPFNSIFRQSLLSGSVPEYWKKSNITPIFKKGSKLKAYNYRPVSLTSIPCKVMEKIIHKHIMAHCVENNLISKHQHGFIRKKGCLTNLLEARDILTEAMHQGYSADIIYTDFAKAFDKVPHKRLLHKLKAYGIHKKLLLWIKMWLKIRKQRVVLGEQVSEWKNVTSGVPQGSVLGPLLFILFINDLPDSIVHKIMLYADDSKIIGIIKSASDNTTLQTDIDNAVTWSNTLLMHFNIDKCKVMHAGRPNKRLSHDYSMETADGMRHTIATTTIECDLGVLISNDLKVRAQVEKAASAANRMLGKLKNAFRSRNLNLWRTLYISYVRPHLEFAIQAWSPYLETDIKLLEDVQDRVTKTISSISHFDKIKRLQVLKLTTLKERRLRGDIIEQFKIFNNYDEVQFMVPQHQLIGREVYNLRGHDKQLDRQFVRGCEERSNFFTNRVAVHWNSLTQHAVNAPSLNAFKDRISMR
ncbi:uncharacterized protein LOC124814999 [Hydra vulgaris]|uniref:uncharacterized protein LOC124814999 n=1 Tax=Hydra vulgaris TaxID=6087 RepID=UPI001F5EDCFD|nr:uncharacterized protein LOC124814999 [Hydra vulgaris]